jgi:hypothetical protein
LEPVESDLLRLAASVVFADRGQRRPRDFSRHIDLQCGVEALEVWSRPVVAAQLNRCLKILTRDAWNIANVDDRACGICPNCLTRRVALVNAGLAKLEQQEDFIWGDLGAPTLEAALSPDLHSFPVTPRHRMIARAAVLVHDDLAALTTADPFNKIPAEIRQVAQALHISEHDVATRLSRLLRQHRDEWLFFLDHCAPPGSWLRALCR